MGAISRENVYSFDNNTKEIILYWDLGEEFEFGFEIQIDLDDLEKGYLETIGYWSFGYEDWSKQVWEKWGEYIDLRIRKCEGDIEQFYKLLKELDEINCDYILYQPKKERCGNHLADLSLIKQKINEAAIKPE